MCKDSTTITKEQFDNAVVETMNELVDDPRIEGMSKLLIPLTGMALAGHMREKLFGKPDDNETEEKKED